MNFALVAFTFFAQLSIVRAVYSCILDHSAITQLYKQYNHFEFILNRCDGVLELYPGYGLKMSCPSGTPSGGGWAIRTLSKPVVTRTLTDTVVQNYTGSLRDLSTTVSVLNDDTQGKLMTLGFAPAVTQELTTLKVQLPGGALRDSDLFYGGTLESLRERIQIYPNPSEGNK
jgi:hypothetical protein